MTCDYIPIKTLKVIIQENGIIRRADTGYLIGRLVKDYKYEYLEDESNVKDTP